jgi:hypothetical protein
LPIMHFDCFIQIILSILLCFRLISLLKMHFLFVSVRVGLKRVDAILMRLKNGKFAITPDYCEALSLATVAHIILKEVDEG